MTLLLLNLLAYSVQLSVLVVAALAITRLLGLRHPLASLRFWQVVFAGGILLPLLQPRLSPQPTEWIRSALVSGTSASLATPASNGVDIIAALAIVVAAGVAIRLGWLLLGIIRLRVIVAGAVPETSLQPLAESLSASLNTTAAITLTDDVHTPATIGVSRPLILLPRRILELPPGVQRAVIAHELVHVKRRDWLHTVFDELWCALLWFHPAARLLASRLALAREMVVDEAVILLTRDRRAYAHALLAFADQQPHLPGVTPLISPRHLSQRISLIAQEDVMSRRRLLITFAIAFFVAAVATASAVSVVPFSSVAQQSTKVYKSGDGVSLPSVVREVKPSYTPEAMQQKIQGSVWMKVVVLESGDVGDVQISKSLDAEYGLDEQAIKASKQWKFKPGMKDGKPVAVEVTVEMTFTLKK